MTVRTCRACGCTDDNACQSMLTGPCRWVGPEHCSACYAEVNPDGLCPEHMPEMPEEAAHYTPVTNITCPICRMIPGGTP
jgi:hypothetical protein